MPTRYVYDPGPISDPRIMVQPSGADEAGQPLPPLMLELTFLDYLTGSVFTDPYWVTGNENEIVARMECCLRLQDAFSETLFVLDEQKKPLPTKGACIEISDGDHAMLQACALGRGQRLGSNLAPLEARALVFLRAIVTAGRSRPKRNGTMLNPAAHDADVSDDAEAMPPA